MLLRAIYSPPLPLAAAASCRSREPATFLLLRGRRRRRRRPYPLLRASLSDLLADLPASLALLAPAAAAAVALASAFSSENRLPAAARDASSADAAAAGEGSCDAAGDWILFTSPTPFNRCVLLRCPSVSFEDGGELLDGVNERLLTEDRHYVNVSRGRIPAARGGGDGEVSYQRLCITLEDGGVIALDWPDNLELGKEHGLDSTVVIVPGTPDGSMEKGIKMFVLDALKNGYFPIVMNPRGCGRSPLTTPRLFTAADSDDISAAVRFINSKRPWTTLMGVGSGYGANMLTKYLAEAGESTPLTAAVCVDNPFDLEEATRSFPHHIALDQRLTAGLVDILRANKELFQGKAKEFDVRKALSATSLRDFDGAISMVSCGFDNVENFYAENSTRLSISRVKIPLLFIQTDDGTVPLFSVPRSSISENPFTSLLLCSCAHSSIPTSDRYAVLWCQHLALEWLSAVEFALLKGRHPLIKDVDLTINPSKGIAFVEPEVLGRKMPKSNNFRQRSQFVLYNNVPDRSLVNSLLVDSLANGYSGAQNNENNQLNHTDEIEGANKDSDVHEFEENSADVEGSHVLQSAAVVVNMLDATMPGTLDDDQKKKVLTAVGRGETLVKALQEAVPDDVRGKLTTSVTEILQSKRTHFSLDALKKLGWTNVTSSAKTMTQEKLKDSDREDGLTKMRDQNKTVIISGEGDQKDVNFTPNDNKSQENIESSHGKPSQTSAPVGAETETCSEQIQPNKVEKAHSHSVINEGNEDRHRIGQINEVAEKHPLDDQSVASSNVAPSEEVKRVDAMVEHNPHVMEKEGGGVHMNEDKNLQNVGDQNIQNPRTEEPSFQNPPSKPPSITVTQALDALTGFDDSTQMAVNSVFGVLENMIDQFQKQNENGNEFQKREDKDGSIGAIDEPSVQESGSAMAGGTNSGSSGGENVVHFSGQPENSTAGKDPGETTSNFSIVSSREGKVINSHEISGENHVEPDFTSKAVRVPEFSLDTAVKSYLKAQYAIYLHEYLRTQLQLKLSNLNSTTDLFLDPQEGKWKMADQAKSVRTNHFESDRYDVIEEEIEPAGPLQMHGMDSVIEPPYVVLENDLSQSKEKSTVVGWFKPDDALREKLVCYVRDELVSTLKIEVGRKLGLVDVEELERSVVHDIKQFAAQVSKNIVLDCELYTASCVQRNPTSVKFGATHGEKVVQTVSTAVQQSSHLRKILPLGVILGVTLASLRNYFHVGILQNHNHHKVTSKSGFSNGEFVVQESDKANADNHVQKDRLTGIGHFTNGGDGELEMSVSEGKGIMVGAVTAALGASALLAHHQQEIQKDESKEVAPAASHQKGFLQDEQAKPEDAEEKSQNNLMSSFAEKALSVAAPVVPTKGDGEVDHERLVAVLAELGQKGGVLRFVGKIALLWGGIRGAMSLTDRLISFLHISERPLFQRILGFSFMVLVLWSPVVIPLLPTLVQSWTISASTGVVGYACIVGLYVSVMILVTLWGKRIRGYANPVEQYGMDLASGSRVQEFFKGLLGGMMIVGVVHSISIILGFATLRTGLSASLARPIDLLKSSSNVLFLAARGLVAATSIALVEELIFRSWLPEEIAVDLGYYNAILISGVAFSLIHRSLSTIPGFLLLSLVLFGIKQRTRGKLAAPVGMRAGIMTASYLIQTSSIIRYNPEAPFWMISANHLHPFDGVIGLSICALLAVLFFPQKPVQKDTSVS